MAWGAIVGAVVSGVGASKSSKKASGASSSQIAIMADQLKFYKGIWNDYQEKYGGLEADMLKDVQKGLDPEEFADRAQTDIAAAYGRAGKIGERRLTRYGIDPTEGKYQRAMGRSDLSEAKAVAGGRTKARRWTSDANFGRRLSALSYGGGLRASALGGMSGAAGGLANLYGNQSALYGQAAAGLTKSAIDNLSSIDYGEMFGSEEDKDKKYADGGVVNNKIKRAADTVGLQNQYRKYNVNTQTSGGTPLSWDQWLKARGRRLGGDQLATKYADGGIIVESDNMYQNGGDVNNGRVIDGPEGVDQVPAIIDGRTPARLTRNEFVIPDDVVMHKGIEHFEKEITKSRSSRGLERRIH